MPGPAGGDDDPGTAPERAHPCCRGPTREVRDVPRTVVRGRWQVFGLVGTTRPLLTVASQIWLDPVLLTALFPLAAAGQSRLAPGSLFAPEVTCRRPPDQPEHHIQWSGRFESAPRLVHGMSRRVPGPVPCWQAVAMRFVIAGASGFLGGAWPGTGQRGRSHPAGPAAGLRARRVHVGPVRRALDRAVIKSADVVVNVAGPDPRQPALPEVGAQPPRVPGLHDPDPRRRDRGSARSRRSSPATRSRCTATTATRP